MSERGQAAESGGEDTRASAALHPVWLEFIRFCDRMQHGEIEQLKIQNGLPLLAETVRQKVKFTK